MVEVELWEAVALTLNFEPEKLPVYLGAYDAYGDNPFRTCPREFQERLQIAVSNCGIRFPCTPVHRLRARCIVRLPAFGAWAAGVWNALPHEFPMAAPLGKLEPQAAPVLIASASGRVELAKAAPLPVEQGLPTKDIAHAFEDVTGWNVERWTKNLSASKWLYPARIAIGEAGGASAVWNPLTLAQLMHDREKVRREKENLMKVLKSRFTRIPALEPWRDAFNDYYATYCATD